MPLRSVARAMPLVSLFLLLNFALHAFVPGPLCLLQQPAPGFSASSPLSLGGHVHLACFAADAVKSDSVAVCEHLPTSTQVPPSPIARFRLRPLLLCIDRKEKVQ